MRSLLLILALGSALAVRAPAQAEPEFAGIGAVLGSGSDGLPCVLNVLAGSPAQAGELLQGMLLTRVNGVSTTGKPLAACVKLIRGPAGTLVWIDAVNPATGEAKAFVFKRAPIDARAALELPGVP